MTDVFVIFTSAVITVLIGAVMALIFQCRYLRDDLNSIARSKDANYRLHKDDYFELMHKHEQLVEALGMTETQPVQKRYVKKGDV